MTARFGLCFFKYTASMSNMRIFYFESTVMRRLSNIT
jgi:hypothetical protein